MAADASAGTDCCEVPRKEHAAGNEIRDWSELTSGCLTNIFHRVSLEDRCRGVMLVCRSWLEAAKDPILFSSFDVATACVGVPDTPFRWSLAFQLRVNAMLLYVLKFSAGGIREIRVRHCSDKCLRDVAMRSPNLEILSVKSTQTVSDITILVFAMHCPLLKELDVSNCFKISNKSFEIIGYLCHNLTILKRNRLNWFDPPLPDSTGDFKPKPKSCDREATAIAQFLPRLKHLELRFSQLTVAGLTRISKECKDLEVLDLFGCTKLNIREVEQASANLKNIKTLVRPNF